MYNRVIELGKKNPMACLVKELVFYLTAMGVLFIVYKYIDIDQKLVEMTAFALVVLFVTSIVHKFVVDKIIGAGNLECPMEHENKTVEENVNRKHGLNEKKSEIPIIPEVNRHKQPNVPRHFMGSPQMIAEDQLPVQLNQMNSAPPQYDMGGYGTLY